MRKNTIFFTAFILFCTLTSAIAGGTSVGGHLKLTVYDRPSGESNGVQTSNYVGFSFRAMYLYISKELTDKVSIDLQPEWSASTGATPRLGSPVAKKTAAGDIEPGFHGLVKAQVNVLLPGDYELGFGIVKPRFSWDYGAELFWEDQANGGKFTVNNYLGAVHDAGIEIYKTYELGKISLPAYVYILNGGYEFSDNNSQPAFMATVEPELGALKLKASLLYGNYDDKADNGYMKYLVGAMYETGPFAARVEYAAGTWAKQIVTTNLEKAVLKTADANPSGFYGKVFYHFASWGRAMLHYDYVDYDFSGTNSAPDGSEKYITFSPGIQLYVTGGSIIQIQYDIADWKRARMDKTDTLKFKRLTVGWRTTF